jgi:predicted Zn-dependent protease
MLAETDLSQGEFRRCVKDWQEALKLAPNNSKIQRNLAIAYRQTGEQEDARRLLEALVKSQPEEADLDYLLGDTLLSLHQPSQAIPVLEKSLRLDPGLLVAESSLAKAYFETGRPKEAIPHFKAALPADQDGALYYDLARAYQQEGQAALAEEMIKRYQEIRGTLERPKQLPELQAPPPK